MLLFALAFLGGVLTILSPCILPVLPFVFTRAAEPFRRSGLPLLVGMALTFAAVATLAAVGGGWVVRANQWGRTLALALVLVFGLALLWPRLADRLSRPFVALGNRLTTTAGAAGSPKSSLLLGVATGLLWAPCAGPILGLILTGAALRGANVETSLLLLAYAAGSAVSLATALLLGGQVFAALKRSLGAEEWIRRALGGAVVVGALAIAFGLDTGFLARVSTPSTTRLEEALFGRLMPERKTPDDDVLLPGPAMAGGAMMSARGAGASSLPVVGKLPPLDGVTEWLNSPPLTADGLRGHVVVVDFWTYSCINCLRALPYVKAWYEKYRNQGLVVIGVHAPEFAFEKDVRNVRREVRDLGIEYPVAVDNDYALWRAFGNQYWPAHYFIDARGDIRHTHFGEGEYDVSERVIQQLLAEAGTAGLPSGLVAATAEGAALPSDELHVLSQETYIGHARAENFASPGGQVPGAAHSYTLPPRLALNEWALDGSWTVGEESAAANAAPSRIAFHFQARDLHLVLGPGADGKPIRFRVRLDGALPSADHGTDVDADGNGTVSEERLYQLIRQSGDVRDRTFEIEFLDPGVVGYAFTFG
ncbi:MAG TPA: cytochrome c biogenesis protein DipZ [Gammaproteobacteria bacterium]|nr:cytochrome c biogenesis protein DipZ [Gammaproteobacteria bacterium]